MEHDRRSNFQDDRKSTCRSFGSNNHPCSQSRKMSIGVMADQTLKLRSGDGEEKKSALPKTEKLTSKRGKLADDRNKSGMVTAVEIKQAGDPMHKVSPWTSTRSLHQETPTAKTDDFFAQQTSVLQSANGTQKKFSKANGQMALQFYAKQTSILHSVNGVGKKLDSVTCGRALGNDGTTKRVEESAFAAALEVCVPDGGTEKGETDKTAKISNEDLRMKLWEILGTAPSPNEQNPDTPAQTPTVGMDNLKPVSHLNQNGNNVVKPEPNSDTRQMLGSTPLPIEQIPVSQSQLLEMGGKNSKTVGHLYQKDNKAVKLRQLSDTIETDTQSTNQTCRRPVTRSSTQKKAPAAVQLKLQHKVNNGGHASPSLSRRGKFQKNIFSFDDAEGWSTRLRRTADGSSSMLRRKKDEKNGSRLAPRKIYLPQKDNTDMVLQGIDRRKTPMTAKRMILHGRIEGSHVSSPQADSKDLRPADMRKIPPPAGKDVSLPANDRTPPRSERMMSNGRMEGSEDHPSSERDTLHGTDKRKTPPLVKRTMFHRNRMDASHNHLQDKTKCLQSTDRTTALPAERTVPCTNGMENTHGCPSQNNRDSLQPKSGFLDDNLHFPPTRKKTNQQEKIKSPPKALKNAQHQGGLRSPSSKKNDPKDDFHPSMFGIKPLSPAREPMNQDVCISAPAEGRSMVEGCCSLRTLGASKRGSFALLEQSESSHDTGELKKSSIRESLPTTGENGAESQLSQSSEEQNAASLEEDLPISKGCRPTDKWSPGRPEKPPAMLRAKKRSRDQEGTKICEIGTTSTPLKGTEEKNNGVQGPSDQNYEDGLERTVALFALSLERFKSKVKLQTSKKCSQILASVAERIQLQLQNAESQILADVGKFTSLGKSKRKRLETRFQEQQERLKVIQDKFKEEVNQHLQDCRSTLKELDAYRMDLKGAADNQKESHRKLLLQVEEATKAQLGEVERRITTIHKVARDKMLELKHVINESSKGVFN